MTGNDAWFFIDKVMAEIDEAKYNFLETRILDPGGSSGYTYSKYAGSHTRTFLVAPRDERTYSICGFSSHTREWARDRLPTVPARQWKYINCETGISTTTTALTTIATTHLRFYIGYKECTRCY